MRHATEEAGRSSLSLVPGLGTPVLRTALLSLEDIAYTLTQYPGMQQPRHFAQVGRQTRVEAEALCQELRAAGAGCVVRRN